MASFFFMEAIIRLIEELELYLLQNISAHERWEIEQLIKKLEYNKHAKYIPFINGVKSA